MLILGSADRQYHCTADDGQGEQSMVGQIRVAFVNNDPEKPVKVEIVTEEAFEYCQLLATTPADTPQQDPGEMHKAGESMLTIPPGTIFGFVARGVVKITNPNTVNLTVVTANGKDPWPQPPPAAPSTLRGVADYAERYKNFLAAAAKGHPKPVIITLTPTG